jgi:LuxR family maltose regulon positive regulatory protein
VRRETGEEQDRDSRYEAQDQDSRGAATQVDPMAVAKFKIPRPRDGLLRRSRLLENLERGVAGPLTLVSAPAGTGKTVLVSAWASRRQGVVGWVSLEPMDESGTGFWLSFVQGLGACGVVLPPPPAQADWGQMCASYMDSVASVLGGRTEPVVVVLDC